MDNPCRRWMMPALALPILSVSLAIAGTEVAVIGEQPVEVDFRSGGALKMDLCSSGVKVVGVDKPRLRVAYDSKKDMSKVSVRLKSSGSEGIVEIDNCPHEDFRITIEVPRTSDLYVRMAAGQLDIDDVTGSKDLKMHAGEMNVELGRAEDYASVEASVMTGEVDAPIYNVNKGGLFRSIERKGPGRYRLSAHVGAGQVSLH